MDMGPYSPNHSREHSLSCCPIFAKNVTQLLTVPFSQSELCYIQMPLNIDKSEEKDKERLVNTDRDVIVISASQLSCVINTILDANKRRKTYEQI